MFRGPPPATCTACVCVISIRYFGHPLMQALRNSNINPGRAHVLARVCKCNGKRRDLSSWREEESVTPVIMLLYVQLEIWWCRKPPMVCAYGDFPGTRRIRGQ